MYDKRMVKNLQHRLHEVKIRQLYVPPPVQELEEEKVIAADDKRKLSKVFRRILGYGIFMWLLILLAFNIRSPEIYNVNQPLKQLFLQDPAFTGVSLAIIRSSDHLASSNDMCN